MSESAKNLSENLLNNCNESNKEEKEAIKIESFEEEKGLNELVLSFKDVWPQVWMCSLANGMALMTGINTGFPTVFISKIMSDPKISQFSKSEASWLASLAVLSGPVGAFCIGPIMDKIGRKKSIIVANSLTIVCWVLTSTVSESLWPLYIARIIAGSAAAMMSSVSVYVSEISHPKVRDVMMIMIGAFVSTGTLITMILGSYIEWHTAAKCFAIIGAASMVVAFFLPESPLWLVSFKSSQERLNKALVLARYFNRSEELYEKESAKLKEIYGKTKKSNLVTKKKNSFLKWFSKNIKLFSERGVYKPMIILFTVFFFWAFSGMFVVLMYSANIFHAIGGHFGKGFDEYTATIIIGVVKLVMTLVSAFLSMKIGRRILMITSSLGMAATIIIAAFFQSYSNAKLNFSKKNLTDITAASDSDVEMNLTSMLTIVSLVLFILTGSLAMSNMPWAFISELLPTKARAVGSSIISSYSSLVLFLVLKSTPMVLDVISLSTLFLTFGIISFISAGYFYLKLPETFGRNFQEIEKYFIKDPNKNKT